MREPPILVRSGRDQDRRDKAGPDPGPDVGRTCGIRAERRDDLERERTQAGGKEACREEQIECAAADEKADRRKHRDDGGDDCNCGIERQTGLGNGVSIESIRLPEDERAKAKRCNQHQFAHQPGAVGLGSGRRMHFPPHRQDGCCR